MAVACCISSACAAAASLHVWRRDNARARARHPVAQVKNDVVVHLMSINVGNRPVVSVISPEVMRSDTDRLCSCAHSPSRRPVTPSGRTGQSHPACARSYGLFHASHPVRKFCKAVETASVTLDVVGSVRTTPTPSPSPPDVHPTLVCFRSPSLSFRSRLLSFCSRLLSFRSRLRRSSFFPFGPSGGFCRRCRSTRSTWSWWCSCSPTAC